MLAMKLIVSKEITAIDVNAKTIASLQTLGILIKYSA